MVRSLSFHICICQVAPSVEAAIRQDRLGDIMSTIDYSFKANSCIHDTILGGRCEERFYKDDYLIKGRERLRFRWDSVRYDYVPDFAGTALNEEKMRYLMSVCPDEPFGLAFRDELQRIVQRGNTCKRAMARLLLEIAEEKSAALPGLSTGSVDRHGPGAYAAWLTTAALPALDIQDRHRDSDRLTPLNAQQPSTSDF
jgi:hypothetical protein